MKLLIAAIIVCGTASSFASAKEIAWQEPWSLSCTQIKLNGKRLGKTNFEVYPAANAGSACCDTSKVLYRGRTTTFGHFTVPIKLEKDGYYYLVFESKTKQIQIPLLIHNNTHTKNCETRDHVFNVKSDGSIDLTTWVRVD